MLTVRRFTFDETDLMRISNGIRRVVFIEEQRVDPEIEYEYEEEGHYYLLYSDDTPVATARWRATEKGIKLERFAMLREFRNKGYGSFLLQEVLHDVIPMGGEIYLHSQVAAANYYRRAGFREYGPHFSEADIAHVLMKYRG